MLDRIRKLHRDERGDAVQTVIIVALIVIPLIMVLIFFGDKIQEWLKEAYNALAGGTKINRGL